VQAGPPAKATRGPGGSIKSLFSGGLGALAGGQEIPAVDDGGGQRPAVGERPGARAPGAAGDGLEGLGGGVAERFEGVAAFDQTDALGGQALELDGAHLATVLFGLGTPLGLLVGVQRPVERADAAVESADDGP